MNMRECKHCGKEQPDNQFDSTLSRVCHTCRRAMQRIAYYRRLGRSDPALPVRYYYAECQEILKTHPPMTRDELMTLAKIDRLQINMVLYKLRKRGLLATVGDKPHELYSLFGQCSEAQISEATKAAVIAVNRTAHTQSGATDDPEYDAWLAQIRARQREKQQRQRMEIRV